MSKSGSYSGQEHIIGFYRGKNERIETLVSDSPEILSERRDVRLGSFWGSLGGGWVPQRTAQIVPLQVEEPEIRSILKSTDYQALPQKVRAVFDADSILRTSAYEESDFSALMYVRGGIHPEGRTGTLLYKEKPVVVKIGGKEFIAEVKGVGVPDGNNFIRDVMHRTSYFDECDGRWGGFEVGDGETEFRNLEILRNERSKTFEDANSPRAALLIEYDGKLKYRGDNTDQAYLLRLSPASIRASFSGNDALPNVRNRHNATARGLAQQYAELMSLDSVLIHTSAHPENLVMTNDGYKFTDFSDMAILAELADPHDIIKRALTDYIDEISGRTEKDIEDYCKILSRGLGTAWSNELKDTKVLAEEVWKTYIAPCAFRIRQNGHNGSRDEVLKEFDKQGVFKALFPLDEVDDKILAQAQHLVEINQRRIQEEEQRLAKIWQTESDYAAIHGNITACRKFFGKNCDNLSDDELLELLEHNYKEIVSRKPDVQKDLAKYRKYVKLSRKYINSPRELAKFDPDVVPEASSLYKIRFHLEREIDLLKNIDGEIAKSSLQAARSRIKVIKRLEKDPYEVIDGLRSDSNYLIKLAVLPYEINAQDWNSKSA